MISANPHAGQSTLHEHLTKSLMQNTHVSINLGGWIITTTEDKVRLAVLTHLARMETKNSWVAPLGICLAIGTAFVTADFKTFLFPAASWTAVFFLAGIASLIWLIGTIVRVLRAPSAEDFVNLLRASQVPLETVAGTVPATSIAPSPVGRPWLLYFSPPSKFKRIVFYLNGQIGEGRNNNENAWRIVNDKLELLQSDGQVFSRFQFDIKQSRWTHTNDSDTKSRDQYIVPENY